MKTTRTIFMIVNEYFLVIYNFLIRVIENEDLWILLFSEKFLEVLHNIKSELNGFIQINCLSNDFETSVKEFIEMIEDLLNLENKFEKRIEYLNSRIPKVPKFIGPYSGNLDLANMEYLDSSYEEPYAIYYNYLYIYIVNIQLIKGYSPSYQYIGKINVLDIFNKENAFSFINKYLNWYLKNEESFSTIVLKYKEKKVTLAYDYPFLDLIQETIDYVQEQIDFIHNLSSPDFFINEVNGDKISKIYTEETKIGIFVDKLHVFPILKNFKFGKIIFRPNWFTGSPYKSYDSYIFNTYRKEIFNPGYKGHFNQMEHLKNELSKIHNDMLKETIENLEYVVNDDFYIMINEIRNFISNNEFINKIGVYKDILPSNPNWDIWEFLPQTRYYYYSRDVIYWYKTIRNESYKVEYYVVDDFTNNKNDILNLLENYKKKLVDMIVEIKK